MTGEPGGARLTRRRFLDRVLAGLAAVPAAGWLAACATSRRPAGPDATDAADVADAPDVPTTDPGGETSTPPQVLTTARMAVLAALFDDLIPGDAASPGAVLAGAPAYVDALLGAFASDPPRVHAGGPYSGRHGGLDGFSTFVPLTRVEAIAWRIRLEGSQGLPEREFAGPVTGWRQRYEEGLDALDAGARGQLGTGYADAPKTDRWAFVEAMDEAFFTLAFTHAVEGTFGDPVYGGNRDLAGWKAIGYEGDRQPVGYSARQMSNPGEG